MIRQSHSWSLLSTRDKSAAVVVVGTPIAGLQSGQTPTHRLRGPHESSFYACRHAQNIHEEFLPLIISSRGTSREASVQPNQHHLGNPASKPPKKPVIPHFPPNPT